MSRAIAIATAEEALFGVLRQHLILAEIEGVDDTTIEAGPLADRESARDWLDTRDQVLLVLDSRLPQSAGGRWDHESAEAARGLLNDARGSGIATPMLVITQRQNSVPELEADCTPAKMAIALPLDQLRLHRAAVLKPFLAMIIRGAAVPSVAAPVPDTFRVIEVEFCKNFSRCSVGYANGTLLIWSVSKQLTFVKSVARTFSDIEIYSQHGWANAVRLGGEGVFKTHVMDAIGAGLFNHIEVAAGGLAGLSFRFVITDPNLYAAPVEASIRTRDDDEPGLFVLLSAPVVRRLPPPVVIHASCHLTARIPRPVSVLFIRSQMCEHADGPALEDVLQIRFAVGPSGPVQRTLSFRKLLSIDAEMQAMQKLADELGKDRMVLDSIDLSSTGNDTADQFLRKALGSKKYDLVHYAGHAWSSGFGSMEPSLLILPGTDFGHASSLPIERFAEYARMAETRFVYLSACRGGSTRSVQSLVMHGVPHALGFRCNVEDSKAADFAGTFYEGLFQNLSLCSAFRNACAITRSHQESDEESPIWITPILLAQTVDWAMRI